jgi:hypothetical protein
MGNGANGTVEGNGKGTGAFRVTERASGLLLGTYSDVFFAVWSTKPTPELFAKQRDGLEAAARANPGNTLFLCVVSACAPPPEQAERDASSRMISKLGQNLLGTACVIEGSGFRAAITRTVLSGILLFIRTPSPVTFFDSVSAASTWMQRRGRAPDLAQLARQLETARFAD